VNKRRLGIGLFITCAWLLPVSIVSGQAARTVPQANKPAATSAPQAMDVAAQRALMDKYCVGCHNAKLKTANLMLDQLDLAHLGDHAEIGEKVIRKLRAGLMPPTGMPRPDRATLDSLVTGMETELDRSATTYLPAPGIHRLNRTEYTNAIRDVLGLQVDATKFLPSDDSTHGFDNIAGALTISPALMEAYLSAAGKISRLAMGDISSPTQAVFEVPRLSGPAGNQPPPGNHSAHPLRGAGRWRLDRSAGDRRLGNAGASVAVLARAPDSGRFADDGNARRRARADARPREMTQRFRPV